MIYAWSCRCKYFYPKIGQSLWGLTFKKNLHALLWNGWSIIYGQSLILKCVRDLFIEIEEVIEGWPIISAIDACETYSSQKTWMAMHVSRPDLAIWASLAQTNYKKVVSCWPEGLALRVGLTCELKSVGPMRLWATLKRPKTPLNNSKKAKTTQNSIKTVTTALKRPCKFLR